MPALILGIFFYWFWHLASLPKETAPVANVVIEHQPVDWKPAGADEWTSLTDGQIVHQGDTLRTGVEGRAALQFFGRAETRLDQSSELHLETLDQATPNGLNIKLSLQAGRVWSRVMRLFDVTSAFSLQTSQVVATVRGTGFDVASATSGTTIWVSDAAVEVEGRGSIASLDHMMVEGQKTHMPMIGTWAGMASMTPQDESTDWFIKNREADGALLTRLQADIQSRYGLRSFGGVRGWLMDLSERTHLVFAGDKRASLRAYYVGRRLVGVRNFMLSGKSGLGSQELTQVEQDVQQLATDPALRAPLREMLTDMLVLFQDVDPSSSLYRLKQKIEDVFLAIPEDDSATALYHHFLMIDTRLDEASVSLKQDRLEEALLLLEAARQGIQNGSRDVAEATSTPGFISTPTWSMLEKKMWALSTREADLRERVTVAIDIPRETTSTTSTEPFPSSTSTAPESSWKSFALSALPNPVLVGASSKLTYIGTHLDGTKEDLSERVTWKVLGTGGTIQGSTFTATQPGSVTIEAIFIEGSFLKRSVMRLKIQDQVTLSRIDIIPMGATTISPGGRVPLQVNAIYSSGLTRSVPISSLSWTTSDKNVGSVVDGAFLAWINGQGSVVITGRYTEKGVTLSGRVDFVVQSPNLP